MIFPVTLDVCKKTLCLTGLMCKVCSPSRRKRIAGIYFTIFTNIATQQCV